MLSDEQITGIKKQLLEQINSNFPEDQKSQMISQIESMDANQLEEFLKQNNLIQQADSQENSDPSQCIFCKIIRGEMPTYKIDENDFAIATLDIRPLSKAHSLIIPKEHITSPDQIPEQVKQLGTKIAEKIKQEYSPEKVEVKIQNMFGHEVINLIPIYSGQELNQSREPAPEEELKKIQEELTREVIQQPEQSFEQEPEKEQEPEILTEENTWLPKRIP